MNRRDSCPNCGSASLTVHDEVSEIRAGDDTMLQYESRFTHCETCGEEFYSRAQSREATRSSSRELRKHEGLLTPQEIKSIRQSLGLTQVQLQEKLGLGKKSVVRWEAGTVCQSRAADRLIRSLQQTLVAQAHPPPMNWAFLPVPVFSAQHYQLAASGQVVAERSLSYFPEIPIEVTMGFEQVTYGAKESGKGSLGPVGI
jgi:HTH-type transcriptional regulator/antitoxin MqsA